MLLIRHSSRANNAVRTTSVAGELFVASVVICMILASFGDAVDPALLGEAGLEVALFDFGGELSVLATPERSESSYCVSSGPDSSGSCGRPDGAPSTRCR